MDYPVFCNVHVPFVEVYLNEFYFFLSEMSIITSIAVLCVLALGLQSSSAQTLSDTLRPQCAFGSTTLTVTDGTPVDIATWSISDMLLACLGYVIVDTSTVGMKEWCTNASANNVSISSTAGAMFQFKSGSGPTLYSPVTGLIGGSTSQLAYHYASMQSVSLQIVAPALQHLPGCQVSFKFAGTVTTTADVNVSRPTTVPFLVHTSDYIIVKDNEVTFYFATPWNVNGSFANLAAVVPTSTHCGDVGVSSADFDYNVSTNLSHITPLPVVSWSHTFPTTGNHYLCTNFNNSGWSLSATLLVFSDNPAYFTIAGSSNGVLYMNTEYSITFVGKNFDLRPGGDRFKVVSVIDGCVEASPPAGGVPLQSDLGPSDAYVNVSESIGQFRINSAGSYLFCYYVSATGLWTSVYNYDTLPHTAQGNLPALPTTMTAQPTSPSSSTTTQPSTTTLSPTAHTSTGFPSSSTTTTLTTSTIPSTGFPSMSTTSVPTPSCTVPDDCPNITTSNPILILILDRADFNDTAALEFRRGMDQLMCVGGADPVSVLFETRIPPTTSGQVTVALGFQCDTEDVDCLRVVSLSRLKCVLENGIVSGIYQSNVISVRVVEGTGLVVESNSGSTNAGDDTATSEESHNTFIIIGIILGVLAVTAGLVGGIFYAMRRKTADDQTQNTQIVQTQNTRVTAIDVHNHDDNIHVGIQITSATEMEAIYNATVFVVREPEWGRGGTYEVRQEPIDPVALTVEKSQAIRTSSNQSTGWADLGEETKERTPAISVTTSESHVVMPPPPPSRYTPVDGTDLDIPIDFDEMNLR